MAGKTKVVILYGGKSVEHEVSCRSAAFVLKNLDPAKYDVSAIGIDKKGRWLLQDTQYLLANTKDSVPICTSSQASARALPESIDPGVPFLAASHKSSEMTSITSGEVVVFPVMHGPLGEDGTLQGLLELAEVAYVGADTLGSAIGMDKGVSKRLALAAGLPVAPFFELRLNFWKKERAAVEERAKKEIGYPAFVKPARLGSSVGISRVSDPVLLGKAIDHAFSFDDKILIERGLIVREIECAVLGDYDPIVSVPGEVIPHAEFYTYDAKYTDENGASLAIPAKLEPEQAKIAQELSKKIFMALELHGMTRVDLFLEKSSGHFFFNEVNTIPGFTAISQFPLLWKESGIQPKQLIDRLIQLAIDRKRIKSSFQRSHT